MRSDPDPVWTSNHIIVNGRSFILVVSNRTLMFLHSYTVIAQGAPEDVIKEGGLDFQEYIWVILLNLKIIKYSQIKKLGAE